MRASGSSRRTTEQPDVPRRVSLSWNILLTMAAFLVAAGLRTVAPGRSSDAVATGLPTPDLVELSPGAFQHRVAGNFIREGLPATAPIVTVTFGRPLALMKHQVTDADYRRCIEARGCPVGDQNDAIADRPAVKINWWDAHAYADWLSRETGEYFRLPTDEEWAYAAGRRFNDDALPEIAGIDDPGQRTLAIYDREANREALLDRAPQSIGSYGANENGLLDVAGNVWEWTDTCFARYTLNAQNGVAETTVNCGVRVVEGRHRTYITDFIRDARSGGCAVGAPPSNLGFRLVRDNASWSVLHLLWVEARRFVDRLV
jgi:formylglycine-generating enzyme required for sulfatase activity